MTNKVHKNLEHLCDKIHRLTCQLIETEISVREILHVNPIDNRIIKPRISNRIKTLLISYPITEWIQYHMKTRNLQIHDIVRLTGLKYESIYTLYNGRTQGTIKTRKALTDLFQSNPPDKIKENVNG